MQYKRYIYVCLLTFAVTTLALTAKRQNCGFDTQTACVGLNRGNIVRASVIGTVLSSNVKYMNA